MTLDLRQLRESVEDTSSSSSSQPVARTHEFSVSYDAPDGKHYRAQLMSQIMDADERILVARIAAQRAGVPWAQLPSAHAARIWAIATLAVQLREPPDWVSEWALMDDALLFNVFDVLTAHESFFFGGDAGQSGATPSKPRVVVDTSLAARTPAE